ncbi:hypothetical protein [Streptomyces violaceus]|uniref:Uncharacterized protein n=1 Tax=Streptomyces violaceus TaxID=1936 RepID=A0ABY9U1Z9_STRVL|nr:hypothetical protein [Streptomyces janthinus]WND15870.1 hypothetical protein RI060_00065 [Streptomyces janthinus]
MALHRLQILDVAAQMGRLLARGLGRGGKFAAADDPGARPDLEHRRRDALIDPQQTQAAAGSPSENVNRSEVEAPDAAGSSVPGCHPPDPP